MRAPAAAAPAAAGGLSPDLEGFSLRAPAAAVGAIAVSPAAAGWAQYSPGVENVEISEESWSPYWFGVGAVAAAAVASAALHRAPATNPARGSAADTLIATMAEQELSEDANKKKFSMLALMGEPQTKAASFDGDAYAKALPGIRENLDFWDPMGFCSKEGVTEGKIKFYREVELKHGRLGMLAALGIVVGENYHPLFGGDIDVPAYLAFQQTPLQTFWPAVVLAIAVPEIYSVLSFNAVPGGQPWSIQADHESGNLGFDPLDLKPTDPEELKKMQTDELTNGRLGMIAAAGMIAQELAMGSKLF
jgi:hypothetical protein